MFLSRKEFPDFPRVAVSLAECMPPSGFPDFHIFSSRVNDIKTPPPKIMGVMFMIVFAVLRLVLKYFGGSYYHLSHFDQKLKQDKKSDLGWKFMF